MELAYWSVEQGRAEQGQMCMVCKSIVSIHLQTHDFEHRDNHIICALRCIQC